MAALHEHQFPLPSLSVRCWFVEGTFAKGNGNDARYADRGIRCSGFEQPLILAGMRPVVAGCVWVSLMVRCRLLMCGRLLPDGTSIGGVVGVCAAGGSPGLGSYSIVPALLPQIMDAWSLSSTQGGWLAGIIAAGYVLGVVPFVAATDRFSSRTVYLACAALSVISTFGVALCDTLGPALCFPALTGLGSPACICRDCAP